ncbi:hypothetical protein V6N13_149062 [Hibiscus sabdariffa]
MHDGWRYGPSEEIGNQCWSILRLVGQLLLGPGVAAEGPSAEPYTPMPPFFSHASSSQFHSPYTPMAPPTEGFFVGAFQPYSSIMTAPSHSLGHFFPPPHQLHTSVAPLSVYPPQRPNFGPYIPRFIICHWTEWEQSSRR